MVERTHIEQQVAIVFIALIALLIPVAGPAVDHHFFERFAFHSHVYLGEPNLDHGHIVDVDFDSSIAAESSYVATSGDGPSTGSITFFAVDTVSPDFSIELEDSILSRSMDEFERPSSIVISIPEEPPRTDSPMKYMESVGRVGIG